VQLEYPRKDGTKLADHLDQILRTHGELPPGSPVVEEIPFPAAALWSIFWQLSGARGSNGFGPTGLSFTEIQAWSDLYAVELTPWEVEALKAMDAEYLKTTAQLEK
jgi:hypothetical protein